MRAILMTGGVLAATAAAANPQMAASTHYVCGDGSRVTLAVRQEGAVYERLGRSIRMAPAVAWSGFRLTAEGLVLRGQGEAGYRTLTVAEDGMPPLDCKSEPPMATAGIATGTVAARVRMALPPGALVTVELRDVSRADAPAPLLARTVLKPRGNQLPLWWRLDYVPAKAKAPAQAGLSARVTDAAGHLIWISDTFTPLPVSATTAHVEAQIVVVPVRAAPSPSSK
jgi:putative lipoprotein